LRTLAATAVAAGGGLAALLVTRAGDAAPRFSVDVQPIFDAKCVTCHPTAYPYLDLRPGRSYASLYRVSATTRPAFERVVPGRPELSYLLTHPPDPSNRDLLSDDDRRVIAAWIEAGANDD
jgi:uncharacterized membrane protein